jgi:hypothetical protein
MFFRLLISIPLFLCLLAGVRCIVEKRLMCDATVKMNGKKYELKFPANEAAAENMARKVCIEKKTSETDDVEHCAQSMGMYLKKRVREVNHEAQELVDEKKFHRGDVIKYIESTGLYARSDTSTEWILKVDLEISGKEYGIQLKPEHQTTQIVANLFCKKNFATISSGDCTKPVGDQLEAALHKDIVERTTRKKAGKRKEKRRKEPSLVDTDEPVAYLSKKMDAAGGKDL